MAAATFSNKSFPAYCSRLDNIRNLDTLVRLAQGSGFAPNAADTALGLDQDMIKAQCLQLATKGYVEIQWKMSADTNTAGVINLTDDLGIDFLTPSMSRRIDVECFVSADVDKGLIKEECLVAMAATPIVYRMLQGFTADSAAATNARAVGAGDWSVALLGAAAVLSQSSNDVILTLTGITNIDTRWIVKIKVYPPETHELIATT
jgi:hypothetical protein